MKIVGVSAFKQLIEEKREVHSLSQILYFIIILS